MNFATRLWATCFIALAMVSLAPGIAHAQATWTIFNTSVGKFLDAVDKNPGTSEEEKCDKRSCEWKSVKLDGDNVHLQNLRTEQFLDVNKPGSKVETSVKASGPGSVWVVKAIPNDKEKRSTIMNLNTKTFLGCTEDGKLVLVKTPAGGDQWKIKF